jgi:N-acetylmuramoyl-L-alanine amidase
MGKVQAIVMHYTQAPGQSAENVRRYFDGAKQDYGSSHYIIDNREIVLCIPEEEIAYHAGPHSKATAWALTKFGNEQANLHSIGVEMCHPDVSGRITQIVQAKARLLCADLCMRYDLSPREDIIRHYDVTGKLCPAHWVGHQEEFEKFRIAVDDIMLTALAV